MVNFPISLDTDTQLYAVHDSLRLVLAEDYNPGDTIVYVIGDQETFNRFPATGIITLTEQCSDPEFRATTLIYSGKGDFTFTGITVLIGDYYKIKRLTNVTQNVMAEHHNVLKDALIACQRFAGKKGETSLVPLVGTMESRINYLRNLVLKPTAWFVPNVVVGIIPLCVTFEDLSSRDPDTWVWDFGDTTTQTITRSSTITSGTTTHCYFNPGIYTVKLTVTNFYGTSTVELQDLVIARVEAPGLATLEFVPTPDQASEPYGIRTRINRPITIEVTNNNQNPLDPVIRYIWNLTDDLNHDTSDTAVAQYSVGGVYDVKVKTETTLGAYRITSWDNSIDVVESLNLWHFIFNPSAPPTAITKTVNTYEFGLLSELYKTAGPATRSITRDYSFLNGKINQQQQEREFLRNNGFRGRDTTTSGNKGLSLLFWAGGSSADNLPQFIQFAEFNGFDGIFNSPLIGGISDSYPRMWNWLNLNSPTQSHFLFGLPTTYPQGVNSPVDLDYDSVFMNNYGVVSNSFSPGTLVNGAVDLEFNPGNGADGDFSVYRGCWRDSNGYFVRNDGGGTFFRIKSFYRTETVTLGQEIGLVRKLPDMPGSTKLEGQLVNLGSAIYFFNNTGEVLAYDPVSNQWATGGPGVGSPIFAKLQDQTVTGYDNPANTLVACSDGDRKAYLFYDYSLDANLVFNDIDRVFRKLPARPAGEQMTAGIY